MILPDSLVTYVQEFVYSFLSPLWFLLLLIPFRIFTYYCFHQRKWNFLHNCKAVRLFLSSPLASIYDIVYMVLDWELTHTKSFLFPATGIHRCSIDLIFRERLVWVAVVISMQSCLLLAWLFCISLCLHLTSRSKSLVCVDWGCYGQWRIHAALVMVGLGVGSCGVSWQLMWKLLALVVGHSGVFCQPAIELNAACSKHSHRVNVLPASRSGHSCLAIFTLCSCMKCLNAALWKISIAIPLGEGYS